ncbi:molybdopterin molybdotransferase MoeA [Streptomyces chartreusis]|uniref:molybdopterin molybdotransferase MoeA n=1 Tax=Streptomyces chartreusis TaxID=1969 RepID=UPI00362550EA
MEASQVESLTLETAIAQISTLARPEGAEALPLARCPGRVLAETVVADEPVPAHASSAMDGFAFRHEDFRSGSSAAGRPGRRLPIQGRVAAGHPLDEDLWLGHAVRIFTGGMMPAGADTVAKQEDCVSDGFFVELPPGIDAGANCRGAGDDMTPGTRVLLPGVRLRPQDIGVAAAVGRDSLSVHRRLRVGLATTGDELRAPGEVLPPGCVRDSNRHTIGAALRSLGAEVTDYGILRDDRALIRTTLDKAAGENDLVLSTGGVSVGDEDHVRPAVQDIGSLAFWRLPIKPGRPVAVGDIAGTPFVGLPGNPVSVLIAFWLIGRPLLLHLAGATDLSVARFPARADFDHRHGPGRREFLRGRFRLDETGSARVAAYRSSSSGMLTSLTWSDGLVEIHEGTGDVHAGDLVSFIPYSELLS